MCASLNFRATDLGCITSILNNNRSYGSDEISRRDAVAVLEKMFEDICSYNRRSTPGASGSIMETLRIGAAGPDKKSSVFERVDCGFLGRQH